MRRISTGVVRIFAADTCLEAFLTGTRPASFHRLLPTRSHGGEFIGEASGDPAMLNYAMSTKLEPDHAPSVVMTGIMYLDVGRTDKALELYRNSIDLTKTRFLRVSWIIGSRP